MRPLHQKLKATMQIISGAYFPPKITQPGYLCIEVDHFGTSFPLDIGVQETEDGAFFYLELLHPDEPGQQIMLNMQSIPELLDQLQYFYPQIKAKSINGQAFDGLE